MKKTIRITILVFFITLVCFGCTTTKPLTMPREELIKSLNNSNVHIAVLEPSSFEDRTSLKKGCLLFAGPAVVIGASKISGKKLEKN